MGDEKEVKTVMREEVKSVMRDKETKGAAQDRKVSEELRAIEPDVYWGAVLERDAHFDGLFVYAVRSTGVYCKPSCPSRRPRREQVSFFASCEEAEGRGFRACRRCLPRETSAVDPAVELVLRVCAFVEAREGEAVSLEELGERERVSPQHLQRTFKRVTGITPRQYAAAHRLRRFKSKIKGGRGVTDALYEAGYGSSSRLY
nr:helix-turn-helix domain-containing protein [Acidobacteriota bacterium]